MTPFDTIRSGTLEEALAMIEADPTVVGLRRDHDRTLLHDAAEADRADVVAALVEAGAELEAETTWGHTPFEWAATVGSLSAALQLLEAGAARLNVWTAAAIGDLEYVEASFDGDCLIRRGRAVREGADLEGWPEDGPFRRGDDLSDGFYIACRNGHLAVAKLLLAKGAVVNATGYFGAEAIHWAAVNGHREVVEWLIEQGADPRAIDPHFDATPASWAREGGHHVLADWLEEVTG